MGKPLCRFNPINGCSLKELIWKRKGEKAKMKMLAILA
jgi:hypothetical protein